MTRFQKDGPKSRRRTRRELPYGQVRRWGSTIGNFKAEREARRAGLTGKVTKHDYLTPTDARRVGASGEREAGSLVRESQREGEEETDA